MALPTDAPNAARTNAGTEAMTKDDGIPTRVRWARLRFQIIGSLLASPPESGDLGGKLDELAAKTYVHPATGARVHFARSTIERWLYCARNAPKDPIRALERKVHGRAGTNPTLGPVLREAIRAQHQAHPRWSYHYAPGVVMRSPGTSTASSRVSLLRYCA